MIQFDYSNIFSNRLKPPPSSLVCFFCHGVLVTSGTPRSKYMAQVPKCRLVQALYKPMHSNCAIYFYPGLPYSGIHFVYTFFPPGRPFFSRKATKAEGNIGIQAQNDRSD